MITSEEDHKDKKEELKRLIEVRDQMIRDKVKKMSDDNNETVMAENSICPHTRECTVLIGQSLEVGSRHYKMFVCIECGKYFDRLGDLSEFEKNVSTDVGRPWKWKEEFMPKEELGSWDPMKNVRLVAIPYEPKNDIRVHYFIPNEIQAILAMTLHDSGIECEIGDIWVSPTITTYTFKLTNGADLSRIASLSNDFTYALRADPVRVLAPIPDTSLIGIEVPNENRGAVLLEDELEKKEFKEWTGSLMVPFGCDTKNNSRYVDLRKQIGILVGGATGSGKSNFFHSIFASLTSQYKPDELRFILADAKRIEFTTYKDSPYLLWPVITDYENILNAFEWCCTEIDRRIAIMGAAERNRFEYYNESAKEKLSYIVILIDEFSDFAVADKDEKLISAMVRVIQTARLVGVTMVIGSSRPCSQTFPPLLMENCPSRLAFSTASIDDSEFIIGESGAEKLLGKGDGLFLGIWHEDSSLTESYPVRLQTPFISDEKIYEHLSRH